MTELETFIISFILLCIAGFGFSWVGSPDYKRKLPTTKPPRRKSVLVEGFSRKGGTNEPPQTDRPKTYLDDLPINKREKKDAK